MQWCSWKCVSELTHTTVDFDWHSTNALVSCWCLENSWLTIKWLQINNPEISGRGGGEKEFMPIRSRGKKVLVEVITNKWMLRMDGRSAFFRKGSSFRSPRSNLVFFVPLEMCETLLVKNEPNAAVVCTGLHNIPRTIPDCAVIKWTAVGNKYYCVICCMKETLKAAFRQQHFLASSE